MHIATGRKTAHVCQGVGETGGDVCLCSEMGGWSGPQGHQQGLPPLAHPRVQLPILLFSSMGGPGLEGPQGRDGA